LILGKIIKIVTTRCQILRLNAPNPAGGAYSAPHADLLAGLRGPTSKEKGGERRGGGERKWKEGEGKERGRKGKGKGGDERRGERKGGGGRGNCACVARGIDAPECWCGMID